MVTDITKNFLHMCRFQKEQKFTRCNALSLVLHLHFKNLPGRRHNKLYLFYRRGHSIVTFFCFY